MSCLTFWRTSWTSWKVFLQLSEVGLKVNANKSHFAKFEIKYLGYWITKKDCKNELCSGITTLYATQESIKLKKPSINISIGRIWEITSHVTCLHAVYVKETTTKYGLLPEKEECVHRMLKNLIKSFRLQDNPYLDSDDPWLGILAASSFAMCSM